MIQRGKNILLIALSLSVFSDSFSQNNNENYFYIQAKYLFKYEGVVFKKDYQINILLKDIKYRITLDSSDIFKAESIFLDNYHLLKGEPKSDNRKTTIKMFYRYKRHFFSYMSNSNEKKVVIQLIDCSRPRRTKKILGKGWEKNFVNYFSDYRVVKIFIYSINLDKNNLDYM